MTASIPLAKGFDASKLVFPVGLSVKHDGVPVRIDVIPHEHGMEWATQSRSGEPLPSCDVVVGAFLRSLSEHGITITGPTTFVAEVTHKTFTDFKDVGGVVRRKVPQDDLILNFFDYSNHCDAPWFLRQRILRGILRTVQTDTARMVHQSLCRDEEDLMRQLDVASTRPDAAKIEGYIARSASALFKPGTRHWDYQKVVFDPTVDLRINGFEEAVSEHGVPLGMVGRILADFHGTEIGIGPGKMSHADRKYWWDVCGPIGHIDQPRIATIKYKRDPSYTALRQPTFQHWREDKTEPSYD
jgi:hypothetical protein